MDLDLEIEAIDGKKALPFHLLYAGAQTDTFYKAIAYHKSDLVMSRDTIRVFPGKSFPYENLISSVGGRGCRRVTVCAALILSHNIVARFGTQ